MSSTVQNHHFSKLARPLQLLQPGAAPANGPAAALAAVSSSSAALEKPRVGPGSCKAAAALQRQQCAYICAQNHCRCWRDAATWSRRRSGAAANVGQRTCCWAKQPSTLASWRCAQIQSAPRRRGPARWRAQPAGRSEAAGRSDGAARQATARGQVKTRHNQPPQSGRRSVRLKHATVRIPCVCVRSSMDTVTTRAVDTWIARVGWHRNRARAQLASTPLPARARTNDARATQLGRHPHRYVSERNSADGHGHGRARADGRQVKLLHGRTARVVESHERQEMRSGEWAYWGRRQGARRETRPRFISGREGQSRSPLHITSP